MTLHWGRGIAIFLTLFIGFILTLVVKAHQTKSDLYAEDYYRQEVNYQQTIDAKTRGKHFEEQFSITENDNGDILISYPDWMNRKVNAQVAFYRPNNAKLDRHFSFPENGSLLVLDRNHFISGYYNVKITWSDEAELFQLEKHIQL